MSSKYSNYREGAFDGKNAVICDRDDGMTQVFYGGLPDGDHKWDGTGHGHISYDAKSGGVDYWREPRRSSGDWNLNNKDDIRDHTRI